jgi:hypothetical protein
MDYINGILSEEAKYVKECIEYLYDILDYGSILYIIGLDNSLYYNNDGVYFDNHEAKRIWFDYETSQLLDILYDVGGINFPYIIDTMVIDWLKEEERIAYYGHLQDRIQDRIDEIDNINEDDDGDNDIYHVRDKFGVIYIDYQLWERFKIMSSARGLRVENAFKLSLLRFLENRYNICRYRIPNPHPPRL